MTTYSVSISPLSVAIAAIASAPSCPSIVVAVISSSSVSAVTAIIAIRGSRPRSRTATREVPCHQEHVQEPGSVKKI